MERLGALDKISAFLHSIVEGKIKGHPMRYDRFFSGPIKGDKVESSTVLLCSPVKRYGLRLSLLENYGWARVFCQIG
jgi:hypothetical protein